MSLPLVSPPLLFTEPSDTVPWRSLSPGGRGEGLQKSRTRSSCALSVSLRPLSHNFTRARIRHTATFPFPVARHSSPQTDGKGLKVRKRKTDEETELSSTSLRARREECKGLFHPTSAHDWSSAQTLSSENYTASLRSTREREVRERTRVRGSTEREREKERRGEDGGM